MLFQFLLSRPYSIGERIYSVTGLAFRFLKGRKKEKERKERKKKLPPDTYKNLCAQQVVT